MSNQEGENSKRDTQNDDEKPLKKAKYMWQVKGKQHLRQSANTNESLMMDNSSSTILEPNTSTTSSSFEGFRPFENNNETSNISNTNTVFQVAPGAQVRTPPSQLIYDKLQRRWEAKQLARCIVDNTVNSLLDNFRNQSTSGNALLFQGIDFDAHDSVCEVCNHDGQVEDDAILMAIQSHGLRGNTNQESLGIVESTQDNFENMQAEIKQNTTWDTTSHQGTIHNSLDFLDAAVSVAIQEKGLSYGY
ncbi:unnamed protein product [Callosobruchus maculatus]|uniref:Uncharacterized protein n=1 Tax=Callosobruchus maculatus TaxID=64391 RepID=A0A653CBA2_CALMS|nr:unnamed protein product [Callosobruchus maculatus]